MKPSAPMASKLRRTRTSPNSKTTKAHAPASPSRDANATRRRTLRAAASLLRREGMAGVSLRNVATRVGVTPMALYRYFPTKDALLEALLDDVLCKLKIPSDAGGSWQEQARALAVALRRLLRANPNVVPLLTRGPALGLGALRLYEESLRILRASRMSNADVLLAYAALYSYTLGFAIVELGRHASGRSAEPARALSHYLRGLPHNEFPTIRALAPRTGRFTDGQFLYGLNAILEGIEGSVPRKPVRARKSSTRRRT